MSIVTFSQDFIKDVTCTLAIAHIDVSTSQIKLGRGFISTRKEIEVFFAFQSVSLVLSWIGHAGRPAFGPFPTSFPAVADNGEVIGYAAVNLVITTIGVGLVVLGHRLRARRQSRSEVSLDTATV